MPPLDLAGLLGRLPPAPTTRYAPSPTGFLHLGHVANAVWVWGIAGALGGRVLLRIEDHDRGRSRAEYERALLDDLEWLGLDPDAAGAAELRQGSSRYRQSDSTDAYEAALARIAVEPGVYACDCSRREIAAEAGDPLNEETRYPGRCRRRGLTLSAGRGVRVVMAPGPETFTDALLGAVIQSPHDQCGDLLVRDRTGNWTYQFAVVVDDLRQGIDLVIRGEDLLPSTGRQVRLGRLLGRGRPPVFLHHSLIRGESGAKLSKSRGDTGVRELRGAGVSPAAVLGRAAWLTGLTDRPLDLTAGDLPSLFREPTCRSSR